MAEDPQCVTCEKTGAEVTLEKCSVCFKYFCHDHAYSFSGRTFCGKRCAEYFFFADPDD